MRHLGHPGLWAALLFCAAAQTGLAASPAAFPGLPSRSTLPPQTGSEKILSTFIHNSNGPSGIVESPYTFAQVDTIALDCPATQTSCTFTIAANVQLGGPSQTGNAWAIAVLVDGNYVNGGPFQGELPADGYYATGYELQSASVAPGKHTVSVGVISLLGATVGYYQIEYSAYKP